MMGPAAATCAAVGICLFLGWLSAMMGRAGRHGPLAAIGLYVAALIVGVIAVSIGDH